ncbi:MAG: AAA family ATPase [Pseudomonadales bacterium]|nr:AAA family ATPase [Pseudomonadales bacterium]
MKNTHNGIKKNLPIEKEDMHSKIFTMFAEYSSTSGLLSNSKNFIIKHEEFVCRNLLFLGIPDSQFLALKAKQQTEEFVSLDNLPEALHADGIPFDSAKSLLNLLPDTDQSCEEVKTFLGNDDRTKLNRKLALRLQNLDLPVLIIGSSGTGKELLARAIAAAKPPLEAVNCAAIPPNLFEAKVFGTERGAFTGAQTKKGLFELADGGTLFLDEIGDLSLDNQAKILRAIQEQTVRRVGGTENRHVKVRIVAATHKDLPTLVDKNEFRDDLYYRIAGMTLFTESLAQHPENIPYFANYFLKKHIGSGWVFSQEDLNFISLQAWPGNIRQLEQFVRVLRVINRSSIDTEMSKVIGVQELFFNQFSYERSALH